MFNKLTYFILHVLLFITTALTRRPFTTYEEFQHDMDLKIDKLVQDIINSGNESTLKRNPWIIITVAVSSLLILFGNR